VLGAQIGKKIEQETGWVGISAPVMAYYR